MRNASADDESVERHADNLDRILLPIIAAAMPIVDSVPFGTNDNWQGSFGLAGTEGFVKATAWSGTDLYVGGEFRSIGGKPVNGIARWDGTRWNVMGDADGFGVDGDIYAIAVDGDDVYVGGTFRRAGNIAARNIAVWNRSTNRWRALGKGIGGVRASAVLALAVDDGVLFAGGRFVVAGTTVSVNIAQWNGTDWKRVGTGINRMVRTLGIDDGYLYAGGDFSIVGDQPISKLARFDIAARTWSGVNAEDLDPDETITAVAFDDEYVYVAGRFDIISGVLANNVARYHKGSGEWSDLLGGIQNVRKTRGGAMILDADGVGPIIIHALAIRGDDLFVGGDFDNVVSQPMDMSARGDHGEVARDMAKWNRRTEVWSKLPRTSAVTGKVHNTTGVIKGSRFVGTGADFPGQTPRDDQSTRVFALSAGAGDELFIGGSFDFAGPFAVAPDVAVGANMIGLDPEAVFAANICRLYANDTTWSALGGAGLDNIVYDLVDDGRYIYAGGLFFRAGDRPVKSIARLDKTTGLWDELSGGIVGPPSPIKSGVYAIDIDGDKIYAGGLFHTAGTVPTGGLAVWNAGSRTWSAVGSIRFYHVHDIDHDGNILAAVGTHGLAIWDGASWDSITNGPTGNVTAVEIVGDKVYVGGDFDSAGGAYVGNVAMWDRTARTWSAMGPGVLGHVNDMEVWGDKLYVAGDFTRAGSFPLNDIAAWSLTTPGWLRVGATLNSSDNTSSTQIHTMHAARYGLYIGGLFQYYAEGVSTNRANSIMLFDGESFRELGNGVATLLSYGSVYALASDAERLHVGGHFHYAGVKPANRFGQWIFPQPDSSGNEWVDDDPASTIADALPHRRMSSGTFDTVDRTPLGPFDIKEYLPASGAAHPDDIYWDGRFAPDSSIRGADDEIFAMASDDTVVYVGGAFTRISGVDAHAIVMWNGSDWETLDDGIAEGIDGFVYALAIDGDDLYVGGQFVQAGGTAARNIAVWNRTTRTWRALGEGMRGDGSSTPFVSTILLHDGKVYAGGTFASAGGTAAKSVAVWDGTAWSPLAEGIDGSVSALEELDGRIYAGGSFGTAGAVSANSIAYWEDGAWHAMEGGVLGFVNDIAAIDDPINGRSIILGGSFTSDAGSNLITWSPLDDTFYPFEPQTDGLAEVRDLCVVGTNYVFTGGAFSFTPNPTFSTQKFSQGILTNISFNYRESGWTPWITMQKGTNGPVNAVVSYGNQIIAGGAFSRAGESDAANIAQYSRRSRRWQPMISGTTLGTISALTLNRGQVYASGPFRLNDDPSQFLDDDNRLAQLGTTGWHLVDGIIRGNSYTAGSAGDDVIVGGSFITADDIIGVNAMLWNAATKSWRALTPGSGVASQEDLSFVTATASTSTDIYLGGRFNVVDTFETPNVAALDRQTGIWRALGDGLDGHVWALLSAPDGSLYAGGDFRHSGSVEVNGVARWDGTAWRPLGDGAANGVNGSVRSLAWGNGRLYVGGIFKEVGGDSTDNVAAWDPGAGAWSLLGDGLGTDFLPSVDAMTFAQGRLFAGGFFQNSGGLELSNIARWNGESWETLGSGVDHAVYAMLEHHDDIYVAGSFRTAGLKPSPNVGVWHDPTLTVERPIDAAGSTLLAGPNPFSERTVIRYTIPERAAIVITIHDMRGVEIARLVDGAVEAGEHTVEWDGGVGVPAGVYVCRMMCGEFVVTEKIVLR